MSKETEELRAIARAERAEAWRQVRHVAETGKSAARSLVRAHPMWTAAGVALLTWTFVSRRNKAVERRRERAATRAERRSQFGRAAAVAGWMRLVPELLQSGSALFAGVRAFAAARGAPPEGELPADLASLAARRARGE